jgi:hypothetical protein
VMIRDMARLREIAIGGFGSISEGAARDAGAPVERLSQTPSSPRGGEPATDD